MRKIVLAASAALILAVLGTGASAQHATRVNFHRGEHSAVVTGYLSGYKGSRIFLIRVRSGQVMKVDGLGPHAVSTFLEGPPGSNYQQDMAADCHNHAEVDSTDAGDYKLTVTECSKADRWRGSFRVRITVR